MNERVIDLPETAQIDYKWVAIGEAFRPEGLQRPMDEAHVERIVAKWNDAAFGTPMLSYREHGNRGPRGEAFAIVSGQHRMEAARRVGKTRVFCAVVYGLDDVGEARLFIDEDKRKPQSVLGKFHLSRLAGDTEAVTVWEIANGCGFVIAKTTGDKSKRSLRCVVSLARANKRGNLRRVLSIIAAAFDYESTAASGQIVDGLSMFVSLRPTVDDKRLAARMAEVGHTAIVQRFRSAMDAFSGDGVITMANVILGIYNHRLRDDAALPAITFTETRVIAPANVLAEMAAKGSAVSAATRAGKTLAEARAEVAARATVNA